MQLGPGPDFLFPPHAALNTFTGRIFGDGQTGSLTDLTPTQPRGGYVLIGRLGAWSGLHQPWIVGRRPLAVYGEYALYDVRDLTGRWHYNWRYGK